MCIGFPAAPGNKMIYRIVMAVIPAIHVLSSTTRTDVDGRDKSGHDRIRSPLTGYSQLPQHAEQLRSPSKKKPGLAAGHSVLGE
jgi:hypothetical protein